MLEDLLTEQRNPATLQLDTLPVEEVLRIMNAEDRTVAAAVGLETSRIAQAVTGIVAAMRRGGRLFYIGAGTSGRLGVLDAVECPPTFNVPPNLVQGIMAGGERALAHASEATEDDPEHGRADLLSRGFTSQDVLAGIASSGRTPYVLGAIEAARNLGSLTVGISCTPDSQLARMVDIAITPLVGPEVIAGSTRLKAGTATKLVLNMMTTTVMIQLGHVFSNLMINVQPRNTKLRDRAERIISEAVPTGRSQAIHLLEAAGDNVKLAILMGRRGIERSGAESLLVLSGGSLSEALEH